MDRNLQADAGRYWRWAAWAGLALFLAVQVLPSAWVYDPAERVMSRGAAETKALQLAEAQFGLSSAQVRAAEVTHLSDSDAIGYWSKEQALDRYEEKWEHDYPADVYRVDLRLADVADGMLSLKLQMETGKLVGWRSESASGAPAAAPRAANAEDAGRVLRYAAHWGIQPKDWEWDGRPSDAAGVYTFRSRSPGLADSRLVLRVRMPSAADQPADAAVVPTWRGGSVQYAYELPEDFVGYLARQKKLSDRMSLAGFLLPQLTMLVLSLVYAVSLRKRTTFRRGLLLSFLFFAMYALFYFNLLPGLRASLLGEGADADQTGVIGLLTANLVVLVAMALLTYFSAVGGDGLWRRMGSNLWPRWRDPGFGAAVRAGWRQGYRLAFILLGAQSLILIGLTQGIGMFYASDASQSTYNMTTPWLLLLLAWCAGISEELQSRLFGIGLFRSWLFGGARRLLGGRAVSPRTARVLTIAAMLPPGLIWAFGHVGYAVYPAYSRLIELVLMSLLFGWFLLRFGLIAVIFAHVVLDTVLMCVQLGFDGLPGDWIAALLGLALPAAVGWSIARLHALRRPPGAAG